MPVNYTYSMRSSTKLGDNWPGFDPMLKMSCTSLTGRGSFDDGSVIIRNLKPRDWKINK